ncbi:50S ribosomal protein L3 N(5)-glutamine methyltransferase [Paraglaciecola sp. 20A4]|uniref:50S ribosomal protein L3 N(5)-glutamine methyltransferase n=1 Tax=Paraglaciecola sp. 20A4 TaxID=2687288 RepID=UPI001408C491|nr:50S ribosomal protein L3 N(5)-glutamine methyltransferase [Paraglaciecola sp. 20A4]
MNNSVDIEQAVTDMHSMLDMVRWAVSQFNQAGLFYGHGTDNPWDEAVCLTLYSLNLPQDMLKQTGEQLFQARLTETEKREIAALVQRRVEERIPLAYLINQAWFCGLPFYVDERVLIPRSPFAELIDDKFAEWLLAPPTHILDLCTGGGCIAIALANAFDGATVDAVDISPEALEVAELNIIEHQLSDRVYPIMSDLMEALQGQKYDLIISNPPYVDAEDMADLPDEFHHEPELALAAGVDGLDLVHKMLRQAPEHLTDDGWLFVEVGNSQFHMEHVYPDLDLQWVEFKRGGHGVFAISRANLVAYFAQ